MNGTVKRLRSSGDAREPAMFRKRRQIMKNAFVALSILAAITSAYPTDSTARFQGVRRVIVSIIDIGRPANFQNNLQKTLDSICGAKVTFKCSFEVGPAEIKMEFKRIGGTADHPRTAEEEYREILEALKSLDEKISARELLLKGGEEVEQSSLSE